MREASPSLVLALPSLTLSCSLKMANSDSFSQLGRIDCVSRLAFSIRFSMEGGSARRRCMYVCRKVKNSQARTGHQRGMGGRRTDDDGTHERHTAKARKGKRILKAQASLITAHWHDKGADWRGLDLTERSATPPGSGRSPPRHRTAGVYGNPARARQARSLPAALPS